MSKLYENPEVIGFCDHMARSFKELLGRSLLQQEFADAADLARALYEAPFVLVAHDDSPDPAFCFASQKAPELWGMAEQEFIGLPSRLSAEAAAREERDRLMARVAKDGYIKDYRGTRIAKNGQRFSIENVILWNVTNDNKKYIGQAAMFSDYTVIS